jgi:hypothetical protein
LNNPGPSKQRARRSHRSNIDTFCPKFDDVFDQGNVHIDEFHYADGIMRSNSPSDAALVATLDRAATLAAPKIQHVLQETIDNVSVGHPINPLLEATAINNSVIARSFFKNAEKDQGIALIELCGGICATLEALLKTGVRVKEYFHCDKDPIARKVAQSRLENLTAMYPDLFPAKAWENAFNLPQDITEIADEHLAQEGILNVGHQWLVTAGWPCQDYSSAGQGSLGQRAALLQDVVRIIRSLQTGIIINHLHTCLRMLQCSITSGMPTSKFPEYEKLVNMLGTPLTFDAAQAGSYARRLRNYWTNLVHPQRLPPVLDQLESPTRAYSQRVA